MSSALSDRRRNLGPTDLQKFPPRASADAASAEPPTSGLRPLYISQGIALHASGSAYLEVGPMKLHATVHGPQQDRGEFKDRANVEVNVHVEDFAGVAGKEDVEQTTSDFVRSSILPIIALNEYPKSSFVVSLSVLSGVDCVSQLAASLNVVTMALVNAGVAMHDMVIGVAAAQTGDGAVLLDADFADSTPGIKQIVVAYATSTDRLVSMLITSQDAVAREDVGVLLNAARAGAQQTRAVLNSFLVEDYARAEADAKQGR